MPIELLSNRRPRRAQGRRVLTLQSPEPVQKTRALYRVVKYTFYKLDPAWRRLPDNDRQSTRNDFLATLRRHDALIPRTYSLIGTRGDADFMLWIITDSMEDLQSFNSEVLKTGLGKYLTTPYSYLAMIRRLGGSKPRRYTADETPIFTCVSVTPEKMLDLLGP